MTKVIYYSATGNVRALAEAVAEGAAEAGAQVRLRVWPNSPGRVNRLESGVASTCRRHR
jgi:flavodoxin